MLRESVDLPVQRAPRALARQERPVLELRERPVRRGLQEELAQPERLERVLPVQQESARRERQVPL